MLLEEVMTSVFFWQALFSFPISHCPASFCTPKPQEWGPGSMLGSQEVEGGLGKGLSGDERE